MGALREWLSGREGERDIGQFAPLSIDDWVDMFTAGGFSLPLQNQYSLGTPADEIAADFQGIVHGALRSNGIIFACIAARLMLFSEIRFQWQQMVQGTAGKYFGTQELLPLEEPWAGAVTSDLTSYMLLDVDLAGNGFVARGPKSPFGTAAYTLRRLQPDWVTIIGGSQLAPRSKHPLWEWDTEVIGYVYHPGGRNSGEAPHFFLSNEVAHFRAPVPDPTARFRGMSWITPVIQEIRADQAATLHKLKYFEQGATVNTVVSLDKDITPKAFREFVEAFEENHAGVMNAYKTIYLGGGADVSLVGSNMEQASFKEVQGAGETRICAAARVPPIIAGLSEGLDASTYSNYGQAKQAFGDLAMRPLWRNACGSLQRIVDLPRNSSANGVRLWYDAKDIPFLREDSKTESAAQSAMSVTITNYVKEGFTPESAVAAVVNNDPTLLVHTGFVSVQLQVPGQAASSSENGQAQIPAATNGNGNSGSKGGSSTTPAQSQKSEDPELTDRQRRHLHTQRALGITPKSFNPEYRDWYLHGMQHRN